MPPKPGQQQVAGVAVTTDVGAQTPQGHLLVLHPSPKGHQDASLIMCDLP